MNIALSVGFVLIQSFSIIDVTLLKTINMITFNRMGIKNPIQTIKFVLYLNFLLPQFKSVKFYFSLVNILLI